MNDNLPMRTEYIDKKLSSFQEEIKELITTYKVPIEFIEEMVKSAEKTIKKEKRLYR